MFLSVVKGIKDKSLTLWAIMSKRSFFLVCVLLFGVIWPSCSIGEIQIIQFEPDYQTLLEEKGTVWLDSLCSETFQGRRSGTMGNQLAFDYLCREIEELGYEPVTQVFKTEGGKTIHNIIIQIPGIVDSSIVIGAHFDGAVMSNNKVHYQAAEDNGSGTVTLLMFLYYLKLVPIVPERTITCCFWDGEESLDGKTFRGSTHYVQSLPDSLLHRVLHYENLDTIGHDHDGSNVIYMEYLGGERISQAAHEISKNGRFTYHIRESTFFNSDYTPFYKAGIPFINYHDHYEYGCNHPNHTPQDTKDAVSVKRLTRIVLNVFDCIQSY